MNQPHSTPGDDNRPASDPATSSAQPTPDPATAGFGAKEYSKPESDQKKKNSGQGSMTDMLGQLPRSVQDASAKVTSSLGKLSTTQIVVGSLLLAAGITLLSRNGKRKKGKYKPGPGGKSKPNYSQANSSDQTDTLQELLLFVNDRIEGYKKAVTESEDTQLQGYYKQLVSQSQQFSNELNDHLRRLGGGREEGTTLKGKVYRRFMEAASKLTGHDEKAILAANVHGEQWALKAYEEALADNTLTGTLRVAVERQNSQSKKTYEDLKKLVAKQ